MHDTATLLIDCPDRKGLVAFVSGLLFEHGANILHADQHRDQEAGLFFMRVEWSLDGFGVDAFRAAFEPLAAERAMNWRLEVASHSTRVALFVSKQLHCLADLLQRWQSGELSCSVAVIVSNHEDAGPLADFYGVPFHCIPVHGRKADAEQEQLELLRQEGIELIVLARYMQVLSPGFVAAHANRIINVHHSFLPAFSGAQPYHQAFERGVKLIGSTSHYVTEVLDDGPIIEQDVTRISHRDQIADLIEKGRDLERIVLSRAVKWHRHHKILRYGAKTVVFD